MVSNQAVKAQSLLRPRDPSFHNSVEVPRNYTTLPLSAIQFPKSRITRKVEMKSGDLLCVAGIMWRERGVVNSLTIKLRIECIEYICFGANGAASTSFCQV